MAMSIHTSVVATTMSGPEPVAPPPWSRATLVAFRFGFSLAALSFFDFVTFVGNYLFFDRIRKSVDRWTGSLADSAFFQSTRYLGAFLLRLVTGSAETVEQTAQRYGFALCIALGLLLIGSIVTVVWSVADRRRVEYRALNRWLRVYARYTLALVMMTYAVVKVIPTQFGFLTPGELLRPVGQLNRFWVLWDFMAVSTGYTVFAGLVELLGCVLLFFRRTTLLGALLLLVTLTNVFAMDVAYNVLGAAIVAGLLIVLSMIVIAPYAAPLGNVLLLAQADSMPAEPLTFLPRWRFAPLAKVLILALLIAILVAGGLQQRRSYFGRGNAFLGLFDVDRFVRAGVPINPSADDVKTWKRVASDGRYDSGGLTVQFASGDVRQYQLLEDTANRLWTVRERSKIIATLTYTAAPDGSVSLDGRIGGDPVQLHLRPVDVRSFPLLK